MHQRVVLLHCEADFDCKDRLGRTALMNDLGKQGLFAGPCVSASTHMDAKGHQEHPGDQGQGSKAPWLEDDSGSSSEVGK